MHVLHLFYICCHQVYRVVLSGHILLIFINNVICSNVKYYYTFSPDSDSEMILKIG